MRLSELYAAFSKAGQEALAFPILIAEPDDAPGDDVDVVLSEIGWIETDDVAAEVRLYPKSAVSEATPDQNLFCVERLLEQLPSDVSDYMGATADARILVELPLMRDGVGLLRKALVDVCDVHISREVEEAWLLVKPKADYPSGQLPV